MDELLIKVINSPDEKHPFLIINKPSGLPSAPLQEGEESALTQAIKLYPQIKNVNGRKKIEYGLLHRIDNETNGLLLIALNQDFYDSLMKSQSEGNFHKWYFAEFESQINISDFLDGFPELENNISVKDFLDGKKIILESFFRSFGPKGREVRPVTKNAGTAAIKKGGNTIYRTEIQLNEQKSIHAHIVSGYRHQVRCHLAWLGFPVSGDKIYNPSSKNNKNQKNMKFTAFKLQFPNPLTNEVEFFQI